MTRPQACQDFEAALDVYLDGRFEAESVTALERHAGGCAACAELFALASHESAEVPFELKAGVLSQTVGSDCQRVKLQIARAAEPETRADLDAGGLRRIEEHVKACPGCAAFRARLEDFLRELPDLAELAPVPSLAPEVLRATLPWDLRLRRRWQELRGRWLARPRLASELAFAATLVLVLLASLPGSPLAAMSSTALTAVGTNPIEALESVRLETLAKVEEGELAVEFSSRAGRVAEAVGEQVAAGLAESVELAGTVAAGTASFFTDGDDSEPASVPEDETREDAKETP